MIKKTNETTVETVVMSDGSMVTLTGKFDTGNPESMKVTIETGGKSVQEWLTPAALDEISKAFDEMAGVLAEAAKETK